MATCPTCGTEDVSGQQYCRSCGSPTSSVYAKPAPLPYFPDELGTSGQRGLAGFWIRLLGFIIDNVILFIVVQLPLRVAHSGFATSLVIVTAVTFLYGSLFIGYGHGQTLGMRAVSVRCVDEDGVTEINYQRASRRAIAYGVLTVVGSIYHFHTYTHPTSAQLKLQDHHALILLAFLLPHIIDLLWVAWDKRNQTLHDKVARTVVVKAK
jgi:uncharacterized RDD family membrane protein YckC